MNTESEVDLIKNKLGGCLGCPVDSLRAVNADDFFNGSRYLYFFSPSEFVKVAKEDAHKLQLQREVQGTQVAQSVGLKTPNVVQEYIELGKGYGAIALSKLDTSRGRFFTTYQEMAALSPTEVRTYVPVAARVIHDASFRKIPGGVDTSLLPRKEGWPWAIHSPSSLSEGIDYRLSFFNNQMVEQIQRLSDQTGGDVLIKDAVGELETSKDNIPKIVETWPQESDEFFVHNDPGLQNFYFSNGDAGGGVTEAMLIDYESASATRYPVLGMISDLKQFYGRAWVNPDVQEVFISSLAGITSARVPNWEDARSRTLLLKMAILVGSIHFAHFPLKRVTEERKSLSEDHEASLPISLLANLKGRLRFLDGLL